MTAARLHADEVEVDDDLVRRLLEDQHPAWADLELRRVASTGTDHAVFRLGADLVIRMPRIEWAEQHIDKEWAALPMLAPNLSMGIPVPVATGDPARGYPFRWLVSPWMPGRDLLEVMTNGEDIDWSQLASDLASLLRSLQVIATAGAPTPGKRGRDLSARDEELRRYLPLIADEFDTGHVLARWEAALAADPWPGPPVWLHGDLLPGNVVLDGGRLSAVIDWASTGAGDPACDLMIAWSLPADARARFRDEVGGDDETWDRARGWVVEQTVPFIPYYERTLPTAVAVTRQRLAALLSEA